MLTNTSLMVLPLLSSGHTIDDRAPWYHPLHVAWHCRVATATCEAGLCWATFKNTSHFDLRRFLGSRRRLTIFIITTTTRIVGSDSPHRNAIVLTGFKPP